MRIRYTHTRIRLSKVDFKSKTVRIISDFIFFPVFFYISKLSFTERKDSAADGGGRWFLAFGGPL